MLNCALTVLTSVIYVQRFAQEALVLQTSLQVCVLTYVRPVLNNAVNMITNNVNAVQKNAEDVRKCVEAWQH